MRTVLLACALAPASAFAFVDPKCADYELPASYDEQVQQDFLANYVALAASYSAVHGPIPHDPGHGALGLDLGVLPPLGCAKRIVLQGTKTEDTNKTPVIPRLRATFAFPSVGRFVPYAGVAYVPPVPLLGTTNVVLSGELGVGVPVGDVLQLGARYHFTLQKTVGEIATPFVEGDPEYDDLYLGSTFGLDAMLGIDTGDIVPFAAIGFTDVSTFFYIGDDGVVTNNFHPYLGPTASLGVDALIKERFRFGAEAFTAPGGFSRPDKTVPVVETGAFSRYGNLTTARFRFAVEL